MYEATKVDGKERAKIVLYALSTCGWCAKTRKFLEELGVAYSYVHVDMLGKDDKAAAMKDLERFNSRVSFPTTIVNDSVAVIGYNTEKMLEAIGDE